MGNTLLRANYIFERAGHEPDIIDRTVTLSSDLRLSETKTISRTSNPGYQVDIQIAGGEIRVTHPTGHLTKQMFSARDFYDPVSESVPVAALARRTRPTKGAGTLLEFSIVEIAWPGRRN